MPGKPTIINYNFRRRKTKAKAKLAPPVKRAVKAMITRSAETKVDDKIVAGAHSLGTQYTAYNTGVLHYLSGVDQGVDLNDRVGNQIKPVALELSGIMRFFVSPNGSNIYWGNPIRLTVFSYDMSLNSGAAAPPAVSDVYDPGSAYDMVSQNFQKKNKNAFTVLYDKVYTPAARAGPGAFVPFRIRLTGKRLPKMISYNGQSSAFGDGGRNAIWAIVSSVFDPVTDTTFACYTLNARLRYKDS